jgi:hypothetical protein
LLSRAPGQLVCSSSRPSNPSFQAGSRPDSTAFASFIAAKERLGGRSKRTLLTLHRPLLLALVPVGGLAFLFVGLAVGGVWFAQHKIIYPSVSSPVGRDPSMCESTDFFRSPARS